MKNLEEEGIGLAGLSLSNVPTTTVGNGGFTSNPSKNNHTVDGYDPILGKVRRRKKKTKEVKEEVVDTTRKKSLKNFLKIAKTERQKPKEFESEIERFSEEYKNTINEDVYDSLYKISLTKKPGKIHFKDKTGMVIDFETAKFLIQVLNSMGPEQQRIFRKMMNYSIINFISAFNIIKRNI